MKNKLTAILMTLLLLFNVSVYASPQITLDGASVEASAVTQNDLTFLPASDIAKLLGGSTSWNGETHQATIVLGNTTIVLTMDAKIADINGNTVPMQIPAQLIGDKVMIPLNFFKSTNFDFKILSSADAINIRTLNSSAAPVPPKTYGINESMTLKNATIKALKTFSADKVVMADGSAYQAKAGNVYFGIEFDVNANTIDGHEYLTSNMFVESVKASSGNEYSQIYSFDADLTFKDKLNKTVSAYVSIPANETIESITFRDNNIDSSLAEKSTVKLDVAASASPVVPAPVAPASTASVVYWGNTGTKLHIDPACRTIKNGVLSGSLDEAKAAGHTEGWCGICSKGWTDERFLQEGNPFAIR